MESQDTDPNFLATLTAEELESRLAVANANATVCYQNGDNEHAKEYAEIAKASYLAWLRVRK